MNTSGWGLIARYLLQAIGFAGRAFPLLKGTSRASSHPWLRRLGAAAGRMTVRLRSGLRLEVNAADEDGLCVALFGMAEPTILRICRDLLRRRDVFLDIGANYGAVGLNCIDRVGHYGSVHMFEPQRDLCARIKVASPKDRTGIEVHEYGLLDRGGRINLTALEGQSATATLSIDQVQTYMEGLALRIVPVEVKDVREVLPQLVGAKPCGVKIDVEGSEVAILPAILALPGLRFVVFECIDDQQEPARQIVEDAGFYLYAIQERWIEPAFHPVLRRVDMQGHCDFLALPTPMRPGPGHRAGGAWLSSG